MKFLWSVAAEVYTDLVIAGLDIAPPKRLFHQPKQKLDCAYSDTILADKAFTEKERKLILEANQDLESFCNGLIELDIVFELDAEDKETIRNNCVLLRAPPTHPSIIASDEAIKNTTLGLCDYMANDTRRLYLVPERLYNPITFRTTATHELGHFIGLDHTKPNSIMYKHNTSRVLYPTRIDAEELAKTWQVNVEDLKYFKL